MSALRTALIATALVFAIVGYHTFYLGFLEAPLRYEGLPWFYKDAGRPFAGGIKGDDGSQFMIGVGKADITG